MNEILVWNYKSPLGELILGDLNGRLCLADWKHRKKRAEIDKRIQQLSEAEYRIQESDMLKAAHTQFEEYFSGTRTAFDVPKICLGTDFQKRVWEELEQIQYGTTISYLELATRLGDRNAIRAVATANGANAISIIIPCHRVIGSDHNLIGYAGGLSAKKKLLQLEGALSTNQLDLFD